MAYPATPVAHTAKQSSDSNGFTTSAIDTDTIKATLIVLWLLSYNGVARPTISDSAGNTWTPLTDRGNGSLTRGTFFYCVSPSTSASHTFTVTGAGTFPSLYVQAWPGALTSGPFDQQSGGSNSGSTVQPGSVTPLADNELVVTGCGNYDTGDMVPTTVNGGFTISDRFTTTANSMSGGMAYLVQTTAAAANPTWTFAQAAAQLAASATFKAGGGAPPSASLFRAGCLSGLGSGGPFFQSPLG